MKELEKQLKALEVKNFFHAGGIYTVYGKFYSLNNLIALPNENLIKILLKKLNINYFNILGGSSLVFKDDNWNKVKSNIKSLPSREAAIKDSKKVKYFYEKNILNFNEKTLNSYFLKLKENYFRILKNFDIKSSWQVDFYVYKNLVLNSQAMINKKKSKFLKKYFLKYEKNNKKFSHLKCFLDLSLFEGLLTKKYTWNPAVAGSVMIFHRKPNIFDPNLTFSLNFLNHSD